MVLVQQRYIHWAKEVGNAWAGFKAPHRHHEAHAHTDCATVYTIYKEEQSAVENWLNVICRLFASHLLLMNVIFAPPYLI
jgi:hypothetical protein